MAPDPEKPHPAGELIFSSRPRGANRGVCRSLQPSTLSREHPKPHACRRLLRARPGHFKTARKDQTQNDGDTAIAIPQTRRLIS